MNIGSVLDPPPVHVDHELASNRRKSIRSLTMLESKWYKLGEERFQKCCVRAHSPLKALWYGSVVDIHRYCYVNFIEDSTIKLTILLNYLYMCLCFFNFIIFKSRDLIFIMIIYDYMIIILLLLIHLRDLGRGGLGNN